MEIWLLSLFEEHTAISQSTEHLS